MFPYPNIWCKLAIYIWRREAARILGRLNISAVMGWGEGGGYGENGLVTSMCNGFSGEPVGQENVIALIFIT